MGTSGTLFTAGKYLFLGGTAFALDLTALFVLTSTLGCPARSPAAMAFAVSTIFALFTQMCYTFRSNVSTRGAVVRYDILLAVSMVFTAAVVDRFDSRWNAYVQRKIFSTGITTLWNYFIIKHWVLSYREEGSGRWRRPRP